MVRGIVGLVFVACAHTQVAQVPRWFVDPSLHPKFGRGTHMTAAATAPSEEEARLNATVLLLRQLGGIEGTGGQVHIPEKICKIGDLQLETVRYKPFALSWQFIRVEEGRLGGAYYAFAYLERAEAAHALEPMLTAAMTRYATARDDNAQPLQAVRDAYAAAAGLALELGSITGNRSTLDALNQDFIVTQTRRALVDSGCTGTVEKTTLSI